MVKIELSLEEQSMLLNLLETCISDLSEEIAHTDRYEYKEMLKNRRAVLVKLQHSLQVEEKPVITE